MRAFCIALVGALAWASVAVAQEAGAPRVDHHTHLWSLEASAVMVDPLLPAVELPAPLAALLAAHTDLDASASELAQLYTEDALFLDFSGPMWIRGRPAIERFFSGLQRGYRMVPSAYRIEGGAGFITGTIARGEGSELDHRRSFHLSVVETSGGWRIAAESFSGGPPPVPHALSTDALLDELDEAGIAHASVFSAAHLFASGLEVQRADERAAVAAENDWLAAVVRAHPSRFIGFCSLNPLRDYAAAELRRCVREQGLTGLKLHFADSGIDLRNPDHRRRLRAVFRAANDLGAPIAAHISTGAAIYGAEDAELFLAHILPAAPDIPVQIAHMGGDGPGLDADAALAVFAEAAVRGDRRVGNLYVDVSSVVTARSSQAELDQVAARVRQLGVGRVLFGSDRSGEKNDAPGAAWAAFRRLPLTEAEFAAIAANAPYLRQ